VKATETDQITLLLVDSGLQIKQWVEYGFNSNFLTPTDGWSLTVGGEIVSKDLERELVPGARVSLSLNGLDQCSGYVDGVEISADRDSGLVYRFEGRDSLSPIIDGHIDPRTHFKESQSLEELFRTIFEPFGFKNFVIDNDAHRSLRTGLRTGRPGKGKRGGRAIAQRKLRQLRPQMHEGAFAFAARVAQRHGLWIWSSPDGQTIILGEPDFDQEPSYKLRRNRGGTNILGGHIKLDTAEQPTIVLADGFSGGGEFGKSRIRAKCVHPILGYDASGTMLPHVKAIYDKHAEAVEIKLPSVDTKNTLYRKARSNRIQSRPLYLHDDESKTLEQLTMYVQREMALRLQKSAAVSYTVEGHAWTDGGAYVPWAPDTIVDVDDDVFGIKGRMYVLGRTFRKSRNGGTTTQLDLILPGSLKFA
jgi:prophage tail gpP-like protein